MTNDNTETEDRDSTETEQWDKVVRLQEMINKKRAWEDCSSGKAFAVQTRGPEFKARRKARHMACVCNPNAGEAETGGFPDLAG